MNRLIIANEQKVNTYNKHHHLFLEKDCMINFYDTKYKLTKTSEEARDEIKKLGNPRSIIGIGGDGTATTIVQEIMELEGNSIIGIIPWNSGDYARALGFKKQFFNTFKTLNNKHIHDYLSPFIKAVNGDNNHLKMVDVGKFSVNDGEPKYFLNWLGIGYFATVSHLLQQVHGGKKPYLKTAREERRAAVNNLIALENIVINDYKPSISTRVAGMNFFIGNYFGNGKKANPFGSIDDGAAELVNLKTTKRLPFYSNMLEVQLGSNIHLTSKNIDYVQNIKKLRVEFKEGQTIQYDGETCSHDAKKLEIEILPKALTMIINNS